MIVYDRKIPREKFEDAIDILRNVFDDTETDHEAEIGEKDKEIDGAIEVNVKLTEERDEAIRERDEARAELARVKDLHEQFKETVAQRIGQCRCSAWQDVRGEVQQQ